MKKLNFLCITLLAILFSACGEGNETVPETPLTVEDGTYIGTLRVNQNDGSFYTREDVRVEVTVNDNGLADIKMLQVSFSARMPLSLNMTIPAVSLTESLTESVPKFLLSGNNIIPLAMGGEFPQYTITGLAGELTAERISFEMLCGAYPVEFAGEKEK